MAGVKTQGTDLYVADPENDTVIVVGCVTSIDGIDTTLEQIETTCLNSDTRTYLAGLGTPGTATFGINFDPHDESHVRLLEMKNAGLDLNWAIGWSDGTAAPSGVDTDSDLILPATRSWLTFDGFMNSFPFSFAQNAVVASTVGIQVSGGIAVIPSA